MDMCRKIEEDPPMEKLKKTIENIISKLEIDLKIKEKLKKMNAGADDAEFQFLFNTKCFILGFSPSLKTTASIIC